jgi:hypothetical protein
MKGYDRLNPTQSIQSTLLIVFTLCIRSSPSLSFLHLECSRLFGSTSTRGVFDGLPTLRHTLGSLLPNGCPSREARSRYAAKRCPSAPSHTVRAPGTDHLSLGADFPDLRREGVTPAPVPRTVRPCAADRPRIRREHRRWFILAFGVQIDANTSPHQSFHLEQKEYIFHSPHTTP